MRASIALYAMASGLALAVPAVDSNDVVGGLAARQQPGIGTQPTTAPAAAPVPVAVGQPTGIAPVDIGGQKICPSPVGPDGRSRPPPYAASINGTFVCPGPPAPQGPPALDGSTQPPAMVPVNNTGYMVCYAPAVTVNGTLVCLAQPPPPGKGKAVKAKSLFRGF